VSFCKFCGRTVAATLLLGSSLAPTSGLPAASHFLTIDPARLPAIGHVDERFLSYNVEAVEVTGGNFWAPYPKPDDKPQQPVAGPHGVEFVTGAYQKRDPTDLKGNERLRLVALKPWVRRMSARAEAGRTPFTSKTMISRRLHLRRDIRTS